ncbi:hypothetical protein QOZ80_9BG0699280 [Eleusine coracana subsp. coracana]|nr:hypothetical protein QOZ80_9BG0699280 [Eleusine coracana subsp. coracana]
MNPRRRLLNLVMKDDFTGVHTLHHIDLHSPKNNLFYPTAAAASQHSPSDFPKLKEMERIRLGRPRMRFQPALEGSGNSLLRRQVACVALSETRTVFLDYQSSGAFLYDDDGRCTVTLPNLHRGKCGPICLSINGTSIDERGFRIHDNVFVMESLSVPIDAASSESDDAGYISTRIDSYGVVDGVVYVSTKGIGTYCFDMVICTWSKAGDWALPFSGKVEHVPELGLLVGFGVTSWGAHYLHASPGPWTTTVSSAAVDSRCPCEAVEDIEPEQDYYYWRKMWWPQLVSLGSGKFCVVQFWKTMKETCFNCDHEEVHKRFAVFTGVEVVRCGKDGDDDTNGEEPIRVIKHKSKVYMLDKDENIVIKYVL